MIALTLAEVAALDRRRADRRPPAATVTGAVTLDSRTVAAGDLFVAVAGGAGRRRTTSSPAAAAAGAVGALTTRRRRRAALRRRRRPGRGAGPAGRRGARPPGRRRPAHRSAITGSSGKTSTKDLLGQVLAAAGPTVSPPGSYNNDIGLPLTVLERRRRRPASSCSRWAPAGPGTSPGSAGSPARTSAWCSTSGRRTSASSAAPTASPPAKGELVEALPDDGTAVLNADDPRVIGMAPRTAARVVTTGRGADADVRAVDVALDDAARARFTLVAGGEAAPGGAAGRRRAPGGQRAVGRRAPRWPRA